MPLRWLHGLCRVDSHPALLFSARFGKPESLSLRYFHD
jgi:hypothetical protein